MYEKIHLTHTASASRITEKQKNEERKNSASFVL